LSTTISSKGGVVWRAIDSIARRVQGSASRTAMTSEIIVRRRRQPALRRSSAPVLALGARHGWRA
jgi:hypothetical protein